MLGGTTALAQLAPPAPPLPENVPDEVIELSPFTITAEADRGYQARSTLAGSRLNSELANVPAPITVMTKDFLEDISAGSLEEALPYSLNVEGISEFSSSEAGRRNFIDNINDGQSNRSRELTGAGTTMNFFPTDIPMSSYNIDRFTFLSGPFEKTTIRGWFEAVQIKYTPVRTTQVFDRISHWVAAGRPLYNNGPGQPQPPNNGTVITRDTTNAVRQFYIVGLNEPSPAISVSFSGTRVTGS